MKNIYDELLIILYDIRCLTYEVARYNPGVEADDKKSLATLAAIMRSLGDKLDCLGVETLTVHDERQMKKHLEEEKE